MQMLTNFKFVQNLANQLINPRPCNYMALDIWKHIQIKEKYSYEHILCSISPERTINLHMIRPKPQKKWESKNQQQQKTCIVYLHGLSSFCAEGNFLVQNLNRYFGNLDCSVCLYDLRGHGKDKAKTITFGLEQSKQLYKILSYLKLERKYDQFILWGRSMGATTVLKMLIDFQKQIVQSRITIRSIVLDSPFSSLQKVALQMISKQSGMPQIICSGIFQYLISAIQRLHNFKLSVQVMNKAIGLNIPAVFLYSQNDLMIHPSHTKNIYQNYSGPKQKIQIGVGHNCQRPDEINTGIFNSIANILTMPAGKLEKRRSVSGKKMGLSVTKNSRAKTIENFLYETQSYQTTDFQDSRSKIIKDCKIETNKLNGQQNKQRSKPQKQNFYQQQRIKTKNSIKLSPKPYNIAKDQNIRIGNDRKLDNQQNTRIKCSPVFSQILKQNNKNLTNFPLNKFSSKKQTKLKLSRTQLIQQDEMNYPKEKHNKRTSIYENSSFLQNKNILNSSKAAQQKSQKMNQDYYTEFKEAQSVFLIRRSEQNQYFKKCQKQTKLQAINSQEKFGDQKSPKVLFQSRDNFTKKHYQPASFHNSSKQMQMIQKRLTINQSSILSPTSEGLASLKSMNLSPNVKLNNKRANKSGIQMMSSKALNSQKRLQKPVSTIRFELDRQLVKTQKSENYVAFNSHNKVFLSNIHNPSMSIQPQIKTSNRLCNRLYI